MASYDLRRTMPEVLEAVTAAATETLKLVTITPRRGQPANAPWWSWRCQRAKAVRRRALRAFQKCICTRHAELYSEARKECSETLRREKQAAWQEFATTCNRFTPLGEVWGQVRSFSSRRNTVDAFPQLIVNNAPISERCAVTNAFAQHFADASSSTIYSPCVHNSLIEKKQ